MARYPQCILVSCQVPWDENEQLLDEIFRREIRYLLQHFNHLYVFGTAGEGYAVDLARFREIVQVFGEETLAADYSHLHPAGVHPMVGVIAMSTANTVERLAIAHDAGFRTFQISLPAWGVLTDAEVMNFFRDVCGAFPDSRFLHYNLPRAGRVLNSADYRPLIEAIPNLVATKTTSGFLPGASDLVRNAGELQHFMGEGNFPHGICFGECSLLASLGPLRPAKSWALYNAGVAGELDTLFRLQTESHLMSSAVLGPIRHVRRMDGVYDKLLVRLGGLEDMPLRLLSPYESISEAEYTTCKQILHEQYPEWAPAQPVD